MGCLADPYSPQFGYCEESRRDWRSGFIVLEFRDGKLTRPEFRCGIETTCSGGGT